jgi:4-amino-4-deoxy-L-arabinose transferase-like glycosyltransferase
MNIFIKQIIKKPQLSIFLIALIIFSGLQYKEAITNYTTRFVEFAEYMLNHGLTLFPIGSDLNPYPDYTITNTFLIYLFSLPFGHLSILSLGMPYCITAALTLVFTYKLGALHEKKWGLYGVLFTLFTWIFLDSVNALALDAYSTLATVIAFYLAYSADLKQQKTRFTILGITLIVGFLFRGPIGLVIPAVVVANYYLISKRWKDLCIFAPLSGLLLILCTATLAWLAYLQGGINFLHEVLNMQGLGRIVNDHTPRYYFYFSQGLITFSITVLIALMVIIKKYKTFFTAKQNPDIKMLLHLSVWFFSILLLLTIPASKKARYILPITPAIALIAGYIFMAKDDLFINIKKQLLRFCLLLPVFGLIFTLLTFFYNQHTTYALLPNYPIAIIGFTIFVITGCFLKKHYIAHPHYELIVMLFGVSAFLLLDASFFNPITYHLELANEDTPKFLPYWFW